VTGSALFAESEGAAGLEAIVSRLNKPTRGSNNNCFIAHVSSVLLKAGRFYCNGEFILGSNVKLGNVGEGNNDLLG
jgi:hypothetical protein